MTHKTLTIGQHIDCGAGEDRDQGTVLSIDGDSCTVAWGHGDRTTQPIATIVDGIAAAEREAETTDTPAVIHERGNGLPDVGDYVSCDGDLYRVTGLIGQIQTGAAGEGNWIRATVEPADWDDLGDDDEPRGGAPVPQTLTTETGGHHGRQDSGD